MNTRNGRRWNVEFEEEIVGEEKEEEQVANTVVGELDDGRFMEVFQTTKVLRNGSRTNIRLLSKHIRIIDAAIVQSTWTKGYLGVTRTQPDVRSWNLPVLWSS